MKPTPRQKLQYRFDNLMAAGAPAMIAMLGVLSLAVILLSAAMLTLGGRLLAPEGAAPVGFVEAIWLSLMRTLDAGTMGGDAGWGFRILMLVLPTLGGIFIISSLIGVLSSAVEAKLEDLRKGRSLVLENDHTVILGWNPQIYSIIAEITLANASQRHHAIAILANRDKVEMEDDLRARLPRSANCQLICRSGDPADPAEIEVVSPHEARSIIILAGEGDQPDFNTIKSILAITNHPNRLPKRYNIVAELSQPANLDLARILGREDNLSVLNPREIISRITAQTSRLAGLSLVYTDLMDFGGDEIYFRHLPHLAGKPYGETLQAYTDASVMGVLRANGGAELNPPMDSLLADGDRLIVLAEDDHAGTLADPAAIHAAINRSAIVSERLPATAASEAILFLGWNPQSAAVLSEMDHYVQAGSSALVVCPQPHQVELPPLANFSASTRQGDPTSRALMDSLNLEQYHHVIVQADPHTSLQNSDAQVLVTLLHLRDIQQHAGARYNIVAEMLDVRNRELASVTKVDDFIVSNHLISMLMAQLSENPALLPVFEDLFNADGSEIYLKPARHYAQPGTPVTFATLVESARQMGETAIGYRIRAQKDDAEKGFGVVTNPNKLEIVSLSEGDKLIVLAQ